MIARNLQMGRHSKCKCYNFHIQWSAYTLKWAEGGDWKRNIYKRHSPPICTYLVRVHVASFKAQGWATVGELEREPHWRELDSERFDWSGNRFGWLAQP